MNPTRSLSHKLFATVLLALLPLIGFANPDLEEPGCVELAIGQPTATKAGGPPPGAELGPDGTAEVTITVSLSGDCVQAEGEVIALPEEGTGLVKGDKPYNLRISDPPASDDMDNDTITLSFKRSHAATSKKWNFFLRPKSGSDININRSIEFEKKCGECDCTVRVLQGSYLVELFTNQASGGMTSGTLYFYTPDFNFPGRAGLTAIMPPNFIITRDHDELITGIDTGAGVIEIQDGEEQDSIIILYKDVNDTTYRETNISKTIVDGVSRFRMDTTSSGSTTRNEQFEHAPNVTILEKGRVVDGNFIVQSRETLTKDTSTSGIEIKRVMIEERRTPNDAWETVSDVETTWEKQLHGWVKTKEVISPNSGSLVSTWEYYQPGEVTGPSASVHGLGKLKRHVRYDGYESLHLYGLHFESVTTPYNGIVDGKTVTTTHNPGTNTTTVTTSVGGTIISKRVTTKVVTPTSSQEIQETYTSQGQKLTAVTHYKMVGNDFILKPIRVEHADGTLTTYTYTRLPGGGYTTITDHGAAENGAVTLGTRTTTVNNARGAVIHRKVEALGYSMGNAVYEEMAVTSLDDQNRVLATAYFPASVTIDGDIAIAPSPAWTTSTTYSCCGVAKEIDRYGIPTFHAYDHLQRRIKTNCCAPN